MRMKDFLVMIYLCGLTNVLADQICDGCDCLIRDDIDRGNINVKPRCRQGKVTWANPSTAIRLELSPGISGQFKACIAVKSESVRTIVSKEISKESMHYRSRIPETKVELVQWFTVTGQSKEYCVTSSDTILLYIEIETTTKDTGLSRVCIHYDMEKVVTSQSPMEECRPCCDEELLKAYCSSEYVFVGSIIDVIDQLQLEKSRIDIQVENMIKQSDEELFIKKDSISMFTPLQCGVRKGKGKFLFTGRTKLGNPTLTCAPFYDQWLQVLRTATELDNLECSYS